MKIIILAGGNGTRLFPLSRACHPKQFLKIAGEKSLFQQTVERFKGIVKENDIVVVTNKNFIFQAQSDLQEIGMPLVNIIDEPMGKNTAPAIALAMAYCKDELKSDSSEILFVTPADHLIKPVEEFQDLVNNAEKIAEAGNIVTIGIKPTKPETGYGYIEADTKTVNDGYKVKSFKEKPNIETAKKYIQDSSYYWNAGMFAFSIQTMENELTKYANSIIEITNKGYDFTKNSFEKMPDISIDYAVAEKSKQMVIMPAKNIYWNDIGSFEAIFEVLADENGNVINGDVITEESNNNMILSSDRLIGTVGIEDMMVIDTPDVLLVSKKGKGQNVKDIVQKLKKLKRKEVTENITMYRPWGSYTVLSEGEGYKVKRITVKPGEKLSLQMHYHRSEHWTVISGTGKLTLDDKEIIFRENESTYIPIGVKHRLENPGKTMLSIIEVQNGKYLEEDDIVRFDDVYGR